MRPATIIAALLLAILIVWAVLAEQPAPLLAGALGAAAAMLAARRGRDDVRPVAAPPAAAAPDDRVSVEALDEPALIVADGRIDHANRAARAVLGDHIVGEDMRLAIRHPRAAAALREPDGSADLPTPDPLAPRTELRTVTLSPGRRLVQLHDRSQGAAVERARIDFVANASHELRTPLAAILGFVETLADDAAGGDPATRQRFLGVIGREATRMRRLVDDLISLSRIESERFTPPGGAIDLVAIVRDTVDAIADGAPGRRAAVTVARDPGTIPGDAGQIAQVVRNLVGNAFAYGRAGGRVAVTVDREGDHAFLRVADEGEGIAPEHLPRLTERFYRVDSGRSRSAGGTGLGLSIVKHIVERHRGRLVIVSTPGTGTTVTVRLPVAVTKVSQG